MLYCLRKSSFSENYTSVDVKDVFGAAGHVGNALLLKKLIDKDIDVDAESWFFGKALRGAACGGPYNAALLLLDLGADGNADSLLPNQVNPGLDKPLFRERIGTPLQIAAAEGHERIVRLLLEPKYHISTWGNVYERAILSAARRGRLGLLKFLINHSKTLQSKKKLQHWILLDACYGGHEPIIKMMVDLGANSNDLYRWERIRR